jgi:hypothetical protein
MMLTPKQLKPGVIFSFTSGFDKGPWMTVKKSGHTPKVPTHIVYLPTGTLYSIGDGDVWGLGDHSLTEVHALPYQEG